VTWLTEDLEIWLLQKVTQDRLVYRYTCRRIRDEGIVRDILTHAGVVA
jgi:hypothetical protein